MLKKVRYVFSDIKALPKLNGRGEMTSFVGFSGVLLSLSFLLLSYSTGAQESMCNIGVEREPPSSHPYTTAHSPQDPPSSAD